MMQASLAALLPVGPFFSPFMGLPRAGNTLERAHASTCVTGPLASKLIGIKLIGIKAGFEGSTQAKGHWGALMELYTFCFALRHARSA